MNKKDFKKRLEYVDRFYEEAENWNRLFNTAWRGIWDLFDAFYKRAKADKQFKDIDEEDLEKIFIEALYDFWRKDFYMYNLDY